MKLFIYVIFVIVFLSTINAQVKKDTNPLDMKVVSLSEYEKKIVIIEEFKNNIANQPIEMNSNTTFRILGGVALLGFLASVTIFKENLFGTVPLTLLAAGMALFLMSV
ncbi:MAG: hypothetical protein K8H86_13560 [Ignavibacteriaceae bacterium]|nr:hypothetical protein [Ignavibacteriaceae bacterium]